MTVNTGKTEPERLAEAYSRRSGAGRYSPFEKSHLAMLQEVERVMLSLLARDGWACLSGKEVLDVGCGKGFWLRRMLDWGAAPDQMHGLDALPDRVEAATAVLPSAVDIQVGDAGDLSWSDETFDVVSQFVVFSSILDPKIRLNVAQEMTRVLKPGGCVLWYDFHMDNPRNPDVVGIKSQEIRRLFPGNRMALKRVTLAPPLARWLSLWAPWLMGVFGGVGALRTHYVGVVWK